ncbi:Gfo/Idh/MocA family oxidoreductase [Nocardioides sp.]|uniref:Gfo/Idh/MocA family protein n=1 Tax=Nocardioides sp. TaxID=35761 RepID=UPI00261A0221|nr:Gfo/Idh/MocA family oxidoreductase [Nocardioides sp.]
MRIGFLGVGRIGTSHAAVVAAHPAVGSLVLGDMDQARADEAAATLGVESATGVDGVLSSGIDALVIASGTGSHAELITAGAEAGIPVFCEKPVALSLAETRAVREAVERAGVQVQIGFQRRFDAGYAAARAAVADGSIGELRRVHAVTADPAPPHASYIPTSGGIYRDCLIHDFDILRWVSGREVVDVIAWGANRGAAFFAEAGDVDETACLLTLDDGTLVTVQGSRYNGGGYDVRMELAGTRGTLAVGLDDHAALLSAEPGTTFPDGGAHPSFWERFTPAYRAEMNAFIDVAAGRSTSPCTVDEALEALLVAEAATLSRVEGRRVTIDEVRR